jgi:hypothetical protein
MKFFLLFSVVSLLSAQNDVSIPAGSRSAIVGNYTVYWCVTPRNTIIYNINQSTYNHFSISYLPTMTNVRLTPNPVRYDHHRAKRVDHSGPRLLEHQLKKTSS